MNVTGADGRHYLAAVTAGSGDSASGGSGSIHAYQVPPDVSGPLDLTVTVQPLKSVPINDLASPPPWFSSPPNEQPMVEPGLVGPWVFHINLPLHSATTVTSKETIEAAGVPINLTFSPRHRDVGSRAPGYRSVGRPKRPVEQVVP